MANDRRVKAKGKRIAINRILDMILPRSAGGSYSQWRTIRRKLRNQLLAGRLDERKLEIEISDWIKAPQTSFDFDSTISGVLQKQIPKDAPFGITDELIVRMREDIEESLGFRRTRRQILTVKEVMSKLVEEEYARLIATDIEVEQESILSSPSDKVIVAQDSLLRVMATNPELLHRITHYQFEDLIYEIFQKLGFTVELTTRTRDGGCDLIAFTEDVIGLSTKYVIEAKHYRPDNRVGVSIVRQLSAVRQKFGAHHGVLVTTSYFTRDAEEENSAFYGLQLNDYDRLLEWLKKV